MNGRELENKARRQFVVRGGALIMGFTLAPHAWAAQQNDADPKDDEAKLPGSLKDEPMLDAWIRIDAQGKITVFTGKAELGQGIKTALIQVAAEELVVAPTRVTLVTADTERTPNEGYTAGSHSMQNSGTAIRNAAAQVRVLLLGLASQRLGAPAGWLEIDDGVIETMDGLSVGYGELVSPQVLHVTAQPESTLREFEKHKVMGRSVQRVDIPAKVTGGRAYVQDFRPEGMVHARIVRPPSPGATLASLDTSQAEKAAGVLKIVRNGQFIGVIAKREYQAIVAMNQLTQAAKWNERETLPVQADLHKIMRTTPAKESVDLDQGNVGSDRTGAFSATFRRSFQMHASIGPSCAVAQLVDGKYTVWTHSQGVYPLRGALAEMLNVDSANIHCIHTEGSGCYGHNAADDVAADAVLMARAMPGRPVRVQWMRDDEHGWEPFGPAMLSQVNASLDDSGRIVLWQYDVWSYTHSTRPGKAGNLLPATHLALPFTPPVPKPLPLPDGGGDRNAIPLYTLPNARVLYHFLPDAPLRVSALRSLGAYHNVFAIESFMEYLAYEAGQDPVSFRLKHMDDPRAQKVISIAAEKFGWKVHRPREGRGIGFAFARYKNQAAYAAMAFEVDVQRDTGAVQVLRAIAAIDSGEAVNPDGLRNQIEGGIVQACSWTLSEEVRFDRSRILSRDWAGYPILRFPHVPLEVQVHIIDRPGEPFLGAGEAAQGPAAAALANAIANATGSRFYDLPITRDKIRANTELFNGRVAPNVDARGVRRYPSIA